MTPLSTELERALVLRIRDDYRRQNWTRFGSRLKMPVIRLTDSDRVLAAWRNADRTLELSRHLLLEQPWGVVIEVLKHEMAHQFVQEILGILDEPDHGPTFQRVCERCGVDAAAHGIPQVREESAEDAEIDRLREKVRRLLALATSSNPHEAELAMLRAREILLRHNLDTPARADRYVVRWIGKPKKRVSRAEYAIGGILARHFHVEVMWVDSYQPLEGEAGTVMEVCGAPGNVEMAEYVYDFLMRASQHAYEARRKEIGGRARQAFMAGVMYGFLDKLDKQAQALSGSGLVWVPDAHLDEWNQRRHPKRRSVSRGRTSQWAAHQQGRRDGAQIILSRPIEGGSSRGGRLLPSGSK